MATLHSAALTPLAHTRSRDTLRAVILRLNGAFLLVASSVGAVSEILSHFWGIGPWGDLFLNSPYTAGFFEAHGLALLISLLLLVVASSSLPPYWHLAAAAVEMLLGTANVLFWDTFVAFDKVPMGVVTTVLHFTFVGAQLWCYTRAQPHLTMSNTEQKSW